MKKLLLVAVTMLAFTFQSNAQSSTAVDSIGSGFELGVGISLPMFYFSDATKTGYNLRASYVLGDKTGSGHGVVVSGIYNKNAAWNKTDKRIVSTIVRPRLFLRAKVDKFFFKNWYKEYNYNLFQ